VNEPTHLDLFSGIGGFALAAEWARFRTIGFCEIDKYCQEVLAKNFRNYVAYSESRESGKSSESKGREDFSRRSPLLVKNICDLNGTVFKGVTLITGGFPCQPFSVAGKRRGKEDDRHLWPEMLRVIAEARPAWVLGENVAGIIGMELDAVLSDLEAIGYATRPFIIPACGVDARHRRNRVWVVAYDDKRQSARFGQHSGKVLSEQESTRPCGSSSNGSNSMFPRLEKFDGVGDGGSSGPEKLAGGKSIGTHPENGAQQWLPEPDVGRVAHGIPRRVDRLRGLGNAIVPQVAYQILKAIHDQWNRERFML